MSEKECAVVSEKLLEIQEALQALASRADEQIKIVEKRAERTLEELQRCSGKLDAERERIDHLLHQASHAAVLAHGLAVDQETASALFESADSLHVFRNEYHQGCQSFDREIAHRFEEFQTVRCEFMVLDRDLRHGLAELQARVSEVVAQFSGEAS